MADRINEYRLLREVGRGATSIVYLAEVADEAAGLPLGTRVALKVFSIRTEPLEGTVVGEDRKADGQSGAGYQVKPEKQKNQEPDLSESGSSAGKHCVGASHSHRLALKSPRWNSWPHFIPINSTC